MCGIPFVFLWQGDRIRVSSKFCAAIRQRREADAQRVEDQRKSRGRRLALRRQRVELEQLEGLGDGAQLGAARRGPENKLAAVAAEMITATTATIILDGEKNNSIVGGESDHAVGVGDDSSSSSSSSSSASLVKSLGEGVTDLAVAGRHEGGPRSPPEPTDTCHPTNLTAPALVHVRSESLLGSRSVSLSDKEMV